MLDAHRRLYQLRDPEAFPGWFREIVIKHCDRVVRRKSFRIVTHEVEEELISTNDPGKVNRVAHLNDRLHDAVNTLPENERMFVALHHFGEASGPELAEFLELPLSIVKRRLRSARNQLGENWDQLMNTPLSNDTPAERDIPQLVTFFVALRSGDTQSVASRLRANPALVEALHERGVSLVKDGIVPFASRATPLITAIERNDLAMQRLLISAGADVNGLCRCGRGEPPILGSGTHESCRTCSGPAGQMSRSQRFCVHR